MEKINHEYSRINTNIYSLYSDIFLIPRSGTLVSYNLYGIGGVAIGTTLGGYIFRHLTNGILKYVVYTYI